MRLLAGATLRLLGILVALAACAPPAGLFRARTLAPSASQMTGGLEMGVVGASRPGNDAKLPWVNLSAGYRRGIAHGVELGGRVMAVGVKGFTAFGVAGDAKVQLRRSDDPGDGTDVATGVVIAYQQPRLGGTPWHLGSIVVPLLVGHNFGKHQLVWGPRVAYELWTGEGQDPIHLFYGGASVAFAWRLGRHFELVPELAILYSPIEMGGEAAGTEAQTGAVLTQLTLGGSWSF
jgi:hypothetical protein